MSHDGRETPAKLKETPAFASPVTTQSVSELANFWGWELALGLHISDSLSILNQGWMPASTLEVASETDDEKFDVDEARKGNDDIKREQKCIG